MKLNRLACALAIGIGHGAWAAGNVDTVSGEASVINRDGQPRGIVRGDRIVEGETVVTGANGEVLVVTDDSGVLAVRPRSRLLIDRYQATGTEHDIVVLNLLRGGLRSVTGWITKTSPRNWRLSTPTATIGIRGTDLEAAIAEEGTQPGTYQRVVSGETVMMTSAGNLTLAAGQAGLAASGDAVPQLVQALPPEVFPSRPSDSRVDLLRQDAENNREDRLRQRQDQLRRSGGPSPQGNPRVSAQCAPGSPAQRALDGFLRAYEQGNTALIQQRLDPSLIGYGVLINDVMAASATQRQTQIRVLDRQAQCGPDVAVIDFSWEKTYLDAATFTPVLQRGRGSVLVSGLGNGEDGAWRVSGFTGDNPLRASAASGPPATLQVAPASASYAALPGACTGTVVAGNATINVSGIAFVPGSTGFCTVTAPACTMTSPLFGTVTGTASANVLSCANPMTGSQTSPISGTGSTTFSGTQGSPAAVGGPTIVTAIIPIAMAPPTAATMVVNFGCSATPTLLPGACAPTPSQLPVNFMVQDSARAGQPSVPVEVAGSNGDRETFLLPAGAPGSFMLSSLPVTRGGAMAVGSGRLEMTGPVSYTITYRGANGVPVQRTFIVTP